MESYTNEVYVKQNSEFSQAFLWDDQSLGQTVRNEGDEFSKGQDMCPLSTKLCDPGNSEEKYYDVNIHSDAVLESDYTLHVYNDKSEALKIVKKYKEARFNSFKRRQEAVEFAVQGPEFVVPISVLSDNSETSSPVIGEKSSPFRASKSQDLVLLRKLIESGDALTFRNTIWDNPRYLVSSGDTPAILQEGSRYNTMHVAAKACDAQICDLILQTVSNVAFIQLLYGDDDAANCQDRARILLDLYLNTPDKALNETPIHFAVKFGALSVVDVLVSYPQCDRHARNKYGQTPRDVICSRVSSPDEILRQKLSNLLDDMFYVPVLRSEDNSVQPTVGDPFSPACPLVLKADPLNPRMEIRAYAGPMNHEKAIVFRKKWKTPPRMPRMPQTPNQNACRQAYTGSLSCHAFRLLDVEKGLERVGRDLAEEFRVGWNEYWPFLDTFTNLASEDRLQKLEAYLKNRFQEAAQKPNHREISYSTKECYDSSECVVNGCVSSLTEYSENQSVDDEINPVSNLCLAFKACSLSDTSPVKPLVENEFKTKSNAYCHRKVDANAGMEDETLLNVLLNPGLSPFLCVEKSCRVFAKRMFDVLAVVGRSVRVSDSVPDMLHPEIRHLQDLVSSFKDDARFVSVDFNLVHSRITVIVAAKLIELTSDELEFVVSGLQSTVSPLSCSYSDEEDDVSICYRDAHASAEHQRKTNCELNQVKCIAEYILCALEIEQNDKDTDKTNGAKKDIHVRTEEECMRIWSDASQCLCFRQNQNFMRNARKGWSFKRNHVRYTSDRANTQSSSDGITRRLTFVEDNDSDQQCDSTRISEMEGPIHETHCNLKVSSFKKRQTYNSETNKLHKMTYISSGGEFSEDDDEYFTPPSTPEKLSRNEVHSYCDDDDDDTEMLTPDEWPDVFIQGDSPTKLDATVMQALDGLNIDPIEYPNIYRWRHLVLLYSESVRAVWSSPLPSRPKERTRMLQTPVTDSSQYQKRMQSSTPPQAWHKITGSYSPLSPQRLERNMDTV